ncbi:MAG TPA: flagellar biosynthesis anti-sigma factor FlgM [Rhodothermales bacterium]|nr:flagellar biosynthesis anti-sigma factor FlgM [Rhodothermales bacterium]
MNIRSSNIGGSRSDQIHNRYVGGPEHTGGPDSDSARVDPKSTASDRVEISDAARSAAGDIKLRELGFAQKALGGIAPLSQERIGEIKQRMESGYYHTPEAQRQIAMRIAQDLTGTQG